ncbi:hypothetical protein [Mucilaginibacter sp. KACC 22063]|uniref:hypothetical protein n=1 Tax=Mucilaginibacter sp. KACC 22063 TaxID=3025666 RepID=UPI002365E791|nr:hypothetical protein [Mucilaginibacter sp. KACC 22063]WDF53393.1 hypothetical protein PQ461_10590 [Mucilaginibacter sp. KACC 22063]
MKYLLILLLIFSYNLASYAQQSFIIDGPGYRGVIFDAKTKLTPHDTVSRWTPTENDIKELEANLVLFMKKTGKQLLYNQYGTCPVIYKNLKKYCRQYAGYISDDGRKMIYVNCFWYEKNDPFTKDWHTKLISVFDGCSFYWQIHYNIEKKNFFSFQINGIS